MAKGSDEGQETEWRFVFVRPNSVSKQIKSTKTYLPDSNASSSVRKKNTPAGEVNRKAAKTYNRFVYRTLKGHMNMFNKATNDKGGFTCFDTFLINGHHVFLCGVKNK